MHDSLTEKDPNETDYDSDDSDATWSSIHVRSSEHPNMPFLDYENEDEESEDDEPLSEMLQRMTACVKWIGQRARSAKPKHNDTLYDPKKGIKQKAKALEQKDEEDGCESV